MLSKTVQLTIEKVIFGGQGLAHHEGKTFLVWNTLPGEVVEAQITRKRRGVFEAIAGKIITPSAQRVPARDEHFLSCSPWQVMTWELEQQLLLETARETLQRIGGVPEPDLATVEIIGEEQRQFEYRNKMEFSFADDASGKPSLAFFKRGAHFAQPIDQCALADPAITTTAAKVLAWIREQQLPKSELKSLIVRSCGANDGGNTIASLFIKRERLFEAHPSLDTAFVGFSIYYSRPESPASVPDRLLFAEGQETLRQPILGKELSYGLFSFFQVNPPMFELALKDLEPFLETKRPVLDFYSGVGSISIPLAEYIPSATLVESDATAVEFAKQNIATHKLSKKFEAVAAPAEKSLEKLAADQLLIVDPPRAGLHPKVIEKILEVGPARVVYMSCNVSTQARDIKLLAGSYAIRFLRLYNFFPRTPHVESLCVLDRRA